MRHFASFLTVGIAFIVLFNHPVIAEEQHDASQGPSTTEGAATERPDQDPTRLKTKEANLLSAVFRLPVPVINDLYGESIPKAVTKAVDTKDETDISNILADLMGTLNDKQMNTLVATVESELVEEKEAENRDKRYIALMERLLWAGKIMVGDPVKTEDSQKYNKSFNESFAKRREKSELIHQKIQDALAGNEQAKQFLRDNLNRRSVLAFIDAQRKSGNTKLANDLTDALSTKVGNEKVLDTFANNESQRLKLGPTRESMEQAIQAYSDRNGGLHNVALASKQHERPRRIFKVGSNGKQLAVTENRPAARESVASSQPKPETREERRPAQPSPRRTAGPSRPATPNPNPGTPGSSGAEDISGLQSFVSSNCTTCHGATVTGTSTKNAKINVDGASHSLASALSKVKSSGSMASLSAGIKSELASWARKQ